MAKRIYNQTALFGELYAYLVVLSPPDSAKAKIAQIKQRLHSVADIGGRNLKSVPHITLTDKLTDDTTFPETISNLLQGQPPFQVRLSAYAAFDHGHSTSLVLTVDNPSPIIGLTHLLKATAGSPNISIAKRLPQDTARRLIPELADLDIALEWRCTEVTVLRKLMSQKHLGWNERFVIPLNGRPSGS